MINLCAASKKNADLHEEDYLILEKYNFFELEPSNQLITISTTGNKSTVVELEADRQLLQIHKRSDSSLAIFSSDTDFHLGDRATVQQLMTKESEKIEQISNIISDSLCKAYQSFGTRDYPAMLKNYYRSYVQFTPSRENKNIRMLIHEFFMEEQIQLIREIVPDEEYQDILLSLRIFFLNPHIRFDYSDFMMNQKKSRDIMMESLQKLFPLSSEEIFHNEAATTIQSFFKMALIKRYKQLHDRNHVLHSQIHERLLKISNLFDSSLVSRLLRNVINRHGSLYDLYPCSKDFKYVLNIQEFGETLENVKHEQWFPIIRLSVNPEPGKMILAAFELLIDLPRFTLRVFNNHNGREMTLVNHVVPIHYLLSGWTVFAYGWSDKQHYKELDWTIRVITMKGDSMFYQLGDQQPLSPETKLPSLMIDELVGTYVPNTRNCISRWLLRTTSERNIISIRLTTSYILTEIRMEIIDENNKILADVNGGSTVLLPLVILKHAIVGGKDYAAETESEDLNKESKSAGKKKYLYYIEAFVLNNSWPLTAVEWTVVSQAKTKSARDIKKTLSENKAGLSTMRKTTKQFASDDQTLEPPYWILQVVTDPRDAVEVRWLWFASI